MNIKLRLKNKPVLIAIVSATVAFVYQVLGLCGIVPPITEEQMVQVVGLIINILVGLGILIDPTTSGVTDSARAMEYEQPNTDKGPDPDYEEMEDGNNGDIIEQKEA